MFAKLDLFESRVQSPSECWHHLQVTASASFPLLQMHSGGTWSSNVLHRFDWMIGGCEDTKTTIVALLVYQNEIPLQLNQPFKVTMWILSLARSSHCANMAECLKLGGAWNGRWIIVTYTHSSILIAKMVTHQLPRESRGIRLIQG